MAPSRLRPASIDDERPEVDRNDADLATLLPDHLARRNPGDRVAPGHGRLIVGMVDPADLVAVDDLRAVLLSRSHEWRSLPSTLPNCSRSATSWTTRCCPSPRSSLMTHPPISRIRQPPRCRRGGADRQVREPRDPPSGAGAGVGHPRRAGRARPAHPVPHRRCAPRAHASAPLDHPRRHLPAQGDGRHRHRRAPHPEGRSHQPQCRGQGDRPAGVDTADGLRREDVMQILDRANGVQPLEDLGFMPGQLAQYRTAYKSGRMAQSSSPVRPAPASRPRSTPRSTCSTMRRAASAVEIRSSTASPTSTRSRPTRRPGSRLRLHCGRSCVRTRTSCWSVSPPIARPA